MPSPRVWSRDDFREAMRLCAAGSSAYDQRESAAWAERACSVLAFTERNAVLEIAQPRDEHGRFASKPKAFTDSPLVIEARAG